MVKPELSGVEVGGKPATSVATNSSGLAADAVGEGCGVGVVVGTGVLVGEGVLVGAGVLVGSGVLVGTAAAGAGVLVGGVTGVGGTAGAATPQPANRAAKRIIGKTRTYVDLKLGACINILYYVIYFIPSWAGS